jgi:hypothetical protein
MALTWTTQESIFAEANASAAGCHLPLQGGRHVPSTALQHHE